MSFLKKAIGGLAGGLGGGLATMALGGILGGGSKSPTVSQATTATAPQYDPIAEAEARRLFEEGQLGQYQTLSPVQQAAIQRGIGMAQAGAPLTAEAQQATQQLLGGAGSFLSPAQQVYQRLAAAPETTSTAAFESALESAISPAVQRATSQFARGGRLGSGLFGEALGRGIGAAAAPTVLAAQQADLNRQMQAAGGLADIGRLGIGALGTGVQATPAIGSLGFEDVQRQLQLGGLLSQEDLMRRQQEQRALSEYQQLLQGSQIGTSDTKPLYQAPQYSMGDIARASIGGQLINTGAKRFGDFLGGLGRSSVSPNPVVAGTGNLTLPDGTVISGESGFAIPR
jgi:hypothetical protein